MKNNSRRIIPVGIILVSVMILNITSCVFKHSASEKNKYYTVRKVIDGDTFWIEDGSDKGTKVRLIGVDAPETRRTRNKEIEYYAQEAKTYLKNLIENKKVRLEYDVDTLEFYKRTLAYVYTEKGLFVNVELVKKGYAMVMTVPPNVRYAEKFVKLARRARKKERGLWARNE